MGRGSAITISHLSQNLIHKDLVLGTSLSLPPLSQGKPHPEISSLGRQRPCNPENTASEVLEEGPWGLHRPLWPLLSSWEAAVSPQWGSSLRHSHTWACSTDITSLLHVMV